MLSLNRRHYYYIIIYNFGLPIDSIGEKVVLILAYNSWEICNIKFHFLTIIHFCVFNIIISQEYESKLETLFVCV